MELSVANTDRIYSCSDRIKLSRSSVEHSAFEKFCRDLRTFKGSLGEASKTPYWEEFLRPLRIYRFRLLAAPLPFDHPSIYSPGTIDALRKHISQCALVYPSFATPASALVDAMDALAREGGNPLLQALPDLIDADGANDPVGLLVARPYLLSGAHSEVASNPYLGDVGLTVPAQFRDGNCYGKLIAVGSPRWFPEHIFSAPRAEEICLLNYSWVGSRWEPEPALSGSVYIRRKLWHGEESANGEESASEGGNAGKHADDDELVPAVDWNSVMARARKMAASGADPDSVEANLFLLEDQWAVFLDAGTELVLDLEEEGDARLKRKPSGGIEPGSFVLLRTSDGGEYIRPMADRLMGEDAPKVRKLQEHWKSKLRKEEKRYGLSGLRIWLRRYGALRAKEENIRNWMSSRNIRPDYDEDFRAVLRVAGLLDDPDKYFRAAALIHRAHAEAGRRIRERLLGEVARCDLRELQTHGRKDFCLPGAPGGRLTAFRVADVSRETVRVPASQASHPFKLAGGLWQG